MQARRASKVRRALAGGLAKSDVAKSDGPSPAARSGGLAEGRVPLHGRCQATVRGAAGENQVYARAVTGARGEVGNSQ